MLKKNLKHQNSNPFLPTLKGVKRSKETSPKHSPREEIPSTPRLNKSPRLSDDEEKDSLHDQISRYIGTVPTTKEKYLSEIEELNNLFHMAEKLYNVSNVFYIYGLPETCDDEKIANNIFSLKLTLYIAQKKNINIQVSDFSITFERSQRRARIVLPEQIVLTYPEIVRLRKNMVNKP
jgi:hypothetical protein